MAIRGVTGEGHWRVGWIGAKRVQQSRYEQQRRTNKRNSGAETRDMLDVAQRVPHTGSERARLPPQRAGPSYGLRDDAQRGGLL